MTRLTPEAEAQLDALTDYYEKLNRPEAIENLIAAVENAIGRIRDNPSEGLNAPRPHARHSPNMIEMRKVLTRELGYDPAKLEFSEQFQRAP